MSDLQDLPEDLREAIEACKDYQRQRPDALAEPPAIVVEARGETCVCMPPGFEANQRLNKLLGAVQNDKRETPKYLETYVAETIFWMRGQAGNGPRAAIDHARKVARSHFTKYELLYEIANQVMEHIGASEVIATSKKY